MYSILRYTLCKPNCHAWIYTSNGAEDEPFPMHMCHCGRWEWRQRDDASREVASSPELVEVPTGADGDGKQGE